jgi:hypothetical protein
MVIAHPHECAAGLPAGVVVLLAVFGAMGGGPPSAMSAEIASPVAYCAKVGDDDKTRKLPSSLVSYARRLFGFSEYQNDRMVQAMTTWRCMSGRVWVCSYGANLPCWKGDISRTSEGGDSFCAENPNADDIPMAATGHGTIYDWRCRGRKAVVKGQLLSIDLRGFVAEMWKPI